MHRMVKSFGDLRKEPNEASESVGQVLPGEIGAETARQGEWVKISITSTDLTPVEGWLKLADTDEVAAPPRPDFSLWAFLKGCVDAEIWINKQPNMQPFFLTADYLIAAALFEGSGEIKNIGPKRPDSDGTGPFQISTADWEKFTDNPLGQDFRPGDREDPLDQIFGAAFLAVQAIKSISENVVARAEQNGVMVVTEGTGPYIPSYADILVAQTTNVKCATEFRLEKFQDHGSASIKPILENEFGADVAQNLLTHRKQLLQDNAGQPQTIDGMYVKAATVLTENFQKAFDLIKEHIPEDMPVSDGSAPWFPIAQNEKEEWTNSLKKEDTPAGTQRVLDYFEAIAFDTTVVKPWCGAFAAFCMKKAGDVSAGMIVKGPATAANWKTFGNTELLKHAPKIPEGAVVVLAPDEGTDSSGHVGFFVRFPDETHIELLGGNQSNTVKLSSFARDKVLSIRWFSSTNETASAALAAADQGKLAPLLEFIAKPESNGNYNAYYNHTNNQSAPELVSKTIAEILAFQKQLVATGNGSSASGKYQFMPDTLRSLIKEKKAKESDLFNAATQERLAIALLERRGLGKFLSNATSTKDFALSLSKEWAALPVPEDTMGDKGPVKKGQSYYAGVGNNKALVSVDAFLSAINAIKA